MKRKDVLPLVCIAATWGAIGVESLFDKNKVADNRPKVQVIKPAQDIAKVIFSEGQFIKGGMMLDARIARGVDCPASKDHGFANDRWPSNELITDPKLSGDFGWGLFKKGENPLVFVGLDSEPPSADGYYTLKSGWALKYYSKSKIYQVDYFHAEAVGPRERTGQAAKLIGETILTTDLLGLENGLATNLDDGQITAGIAVGSANQTSNGEVSWNFGETEVSLNVSCDLPPSNSLPKL